MRSFRLLLPFAAWAGLACGRVPIEMLEQNGGQDASGDATESDCGDELVEGDEDCDLGDANGGPDGLCTIACKSAAVELTPLLQTTMLGRGDHLRVGRIDDAQGPLDVVGYDNAPAVGIFVITNFIGNPNLVNPIEQQFNVGQKPATGLELYDYDNDGREEPIWVGAGDPSGVPATSVHVLQAYPPAGATPIQDIDHDPVYGSVGGPVHGVSVNHGNDMTRDLVFFDMGSLTAGAPTKGACIGWILTGFPSKNWNCSGAANTDYFSVVYQDEQPKVMRFLSDPPGHIVYEFAFTPGSANPHTINVSGFVDTGITIMSAVAADMLLEMGDELVVLLPDGTVQIWRVSADLAAGPEFGKAMAGSTDLLVADLNGDGLKDVVVAQPDGTFAAMVNGGNAHSVRNQTLSVNPGASFNAIAGGIDYDGDGLVDFIASARQKLFHVGIGPASE